MGVVSDREEGLADDGSSGDGHRLRQAARHLAGRTRLCLDLEDDKPQVLRRLRRGSRLRHAPVKPFVKVEVPLSYERDERVKRVGEWHLVDQVRSEEHTSELQSLMRI